MIVQTPDFVETMRREHAELHRLIHQAKTLLQHPQSLPELSTSLAALLETVERHFACEENGGYLTEVLRRQPSLEPEVGALLNEHAVLRAELVRAFRLSGEPAKRAALAASCRQWFDHLARHEAHENRLVQVVFGTDIGVAD